MLPIYWLLFCWNPVFMFIDIRDPFIMPCIWNPIG